MSSDKPTAAGSDWIRRELPGIPASIEALWVCKTESGYRYGLQLDARHHNAQGFIHGGVLTAFADHAMSLVAWERSGRAPCTTVQMNTQFLTALRAPAFVDIDTTVTKQGREMIFLHGLVRCGDEPVMEVSGLWKVFNKR